MVRGTAGRKKRSPADPTVARAYRPTGGRDPQKVGKLVDIKKIGYRDGVDLLTVLSNFIPLILMIMLTKNNDILHVKL